MVARCRRASTSARFRRRCSSHSVPTSPLTREAHQHARRAGDTARRRRHSILESHDRVAWESALGNLPATERARVEHGGERRGGDRNVANRACGGDSKSHLGDLHTDQPLIHHVATDDALAEVPG